jgi:hypothetical protein
MAAWPSLTIDGSAFRAGAAKATSSEPSGNCATIQPAGTVNTGISADSRQSVARDHGVKDTSSTTASTMA